MAEMLEGIGMGGGNESGDGLPRYARNDDSAAHAPLTAPPRSLWRLDYPRCDAIYLLHREVASIPVIARP